MVHKHDMKEKCQNKMCTGVDRYTVRQFFVLAAGCLTSFCSGIMLSFPSVLNPSIMSPNSTFNATSNQASWIAASHGISGILGFFIFSPLFQIVGRKYVNLGLNIVQLIGWIIFIFADSIFDLLSARLTQGLVVGSYFISAVTVAEYCDPKRRGYFMGMKKIALAFGSLSCHSLVLFINWRQISMFSCGPLILSCLMILFWPESPAFLAMKGRFDECEKSFIWANGTSARAQKQLKELINAQSERLNRKNNSTTNVFLPTKLLKKFFRKDFLKPLLITSVLAIAIDASGRFFLLTYLTQIIAEITGDQSFAMYCAIASDLLLICALSTSCFVIRYFNRRTILFTLGTFAMILMFLVSLALVLQTHFYIGTDVRWLLPMIILMHGFISHIGIVPTAFAILAEIFPLEHKGLGCLASGVIFTSFYALTMKSTPLMIEYTGVAGTYAIYGLCVMLCLIVLHFILPETKDKTLQQIESDIKGNEKSPENAVLIDNVSDLHKNTDKYKNVATTA